MIRLAFDRSVRTYDQDGHLHVASSVISAAEVSDYMGAEIPDAAKLGLNLNRTYALLRDPADLRKAVSSFQGKPLLSTHRPQTADDHDHSLVVGSVNNPAWNDPYLTAELVVWNADAIKGIEDGTQRCLSAGYRYVPVMQGGTYQGKPYQGRMTAILGNHVTLCPVPRVSSAFVGDSLPRPRKTGVLVMDTNDDTETKLRTYLADKLKPDDMQGVQDILDEAKAGGGFTFADASPDTAMDSAMRRRQWQTHNQAYGTRFPNAKRLMRAG